MAQISLKLKRNSKDPVFYFMSLLNGVFKLTPTELDVLREFIRVDPTQIKGPKCRVEVAKALNFSNVLVVGNYVKALKEKGVINGTRTGYRYHPIINSVIEASKSSEDVEINISVSE